MKASFLPIFTKLRGRGLGNQKPGKKGHVCVENSLIALHYTPPKRLDAKS